MQCAALLFGDNTKFTTDRHVRQNHEAKLGLMNSAEQSRQRQLSPGWFFQIIEKERIAIFSTALFFYAKDTAKPIFLLT